MTAAVEKPTTKKKRAPVSEKEAGMQFLSSNKSHQQEIGIHKVQVKMAMEV